MVLHEYFSPDAVGADDKSGEQEFLKSLPPWDASSLIPTDLGLKIISPESPNGLFSRDIFTQKFIEKLLLKKMLFWVYVLCPIRYIGNKRKSHFWHQCCVFKTVPLINYILLKLGFIYNPGCCETQLVGLPNLYIGTKENSKSGFK